MNNNEEMQLILNGLYRDRQELTKKLTDVERLIKKIKLGTFALDLAANNNEAVNHSPENISYTKEERQIEFPLRGELRVQVISVFDMVGVACKLKTIQDKYKELTGLRVNLRETVRTLYKHKILRLLKPRGTERGMYWVKEEWLESDGCRLKDEHKFEGFALIYNDEDIEYTTA